MAVTVLPLDGGGLMQRVLANGAAVFTLPAPPAVAPLPMGFTIEISDNTGTFATTNMVVTGPINQITSTTSTISTANSRTTYQWVGDRYLSK
jgi:hypothetical protein